MYHLFWTSSTLNNFKSSVLTLKIFLFSARNFFVAATIFSFDKISLSRILIGFPKAMAGVPVAVLREIFQLPCVLMKVCQSAELFAFSKEL